MKTAIRSNLRNSAPATFMILTEPIGLLQLIQLGLYVADDLKSVFAKAHHHDAAGDLPLASSLGDSAAQGTEGRVSSRPEGEPAVSYNS